MKSYWFEKFRIDAENLSIHFRFRRLKDGFWRIYWKDHYAGECFEEMTQNGYNIETYDYRLESQSYYEEYEDHVKTVRTIKNFVEGYWNGMASLKRKLYQLRRDKEFFETSQRAYKGMVIR